MCGGAQPDVAKCLINGIAASSGCNVTNPSQFNTSTTKTCVDKTVGPNCKKDLKSYPNSPVKSSNGGEGGGGGDSKKGPSALEIIIIVVAVLALLGLVGFLAYRAKK